jgi:hypothetical protein
MERIVVAAPEGKGSTCPPGGIPPPRYIVRHGGLSKRNDSDSSLPDLHLKE